MYRLLPPCSETHAVCNTAGHALGHLHLSRIRPLLAAILKTGQASVADTLTVCSTACLKSACDGCSGGGTCSLIKDIKKQVQQLQELLGVAGAQSGATIGALETHFRRVFANAVGLEHGTDGMRSTAQMAHHAFGHVSLLFTRTFWEGKRTALSSPEGVFHQDLLFRDEVAGLFALCKQSAARVSATHVAALAESQQQGATEPCLKDVLLSIFSVSAVFVI